MRVLVAGASGVVGGVLVPALIARGHEVTGMVRSPASAEVVRKMGARPVVADALDAQTVLDVLRGVVPHAVSHQLTDIPHAADFRHFARVFEVTNHLRREGLDNLLAASRATGVQRFVSQSFCGWPFARQGGSIKSEEDPLDPNPPAEMATSFDALRHVESTMTSALDVRGMSLRYGFFYGPGTFISQDGPMVVQVRRRRVPVVGSGAGVWSFIHVRDVASATIAAIEGDAVGTFNVVDDEPAPVRDWLPGLARALCAREPLRVPAWIGRLFLPEHLYSMMTQIRGGSNAKFKRTFTWRPSFPSWREGFVGGL